MTMQQTSLLAYSEIRDLLSDRQAKVLDTIQAFGPMNNKQIAARLGWPINTVTPRTLELRRKELVDLDRVDVDAQGHRCSFWKVK